MIQDISKLLQIFGLRSYAVQRLHPRCSKSTALNGL